MKILLVSATEKECILIQNKLEKMNFLGFEINFLVTTPSIPFTMFNFLEYLRTNSHDLYFNIGLCGSFKKEIPVGTVAEIKSDCFADIEITYEQHAVSLFENGFISPDEFPFNSGRIINKNPKIPNLPQYNAITVNSTSGSEKNINERIERFNPDLESMEGAAFAYICEKKSLRYHQIRAVSNLIKRRDLQEWNIELALENLSETTLKVIKNYNR